MSVVSVIIPIYNVENYLDQCIKSVIDQTYKDLEIILVNDGSTDLSEKLCDKWKNMDSRIEVIHKSNGGLSDARNAGLDIAKGEYILFVDSDDFIDENMVEILINKIGNASMAVCNIRYVDEQSQSLETPIKEFQRDEIWDQNKFWKEYYAGYCVTCVVAWNKLYKREIFEHIRYDYGKRNEDEFIIDKIVELCDKICICEDVLYNYRQRRNSIMNQKFGIKNLDLIEAVVNRTIRFKQKKKHRLFVQSYIHLHGVLSAASYQISDNDKECRTKYLEQKKYFKQLYFQAAFHCISLKNFLKITMFIISEKVYFKLKG